MLHFFHSHSHSHSHSHRVDTNHTDNVHPHHHWNPLQKYYLSHHNKFIHMLTAIQKSDLEMMELLLTSGVNASSTLPCGLSLLHYAVLFYQPDTIELLLTKGANIDAVDPNNKTSLFYAAEHQKWDAFSLLFKWGANVNIRAQDCLLSRNKYENVLALDVVRFKMGKEAGEAFWDECRETYHRVTFL